MKKFILEIAVTAATSTTKKHIREWSEKVMRDAAIESDVVTKTAVRKCDLD